MRFLSLFIIMLLATPAAAKQVFQAPELFVQDAFSGAAPERKTFWITKELRPEVNNIMQHHYPVLKVRYWQQQARTVWILEEIGKVKPITAGFVVDGGMLDYMKVLIYRESHGWEVKHPFFTKQFKALTLSDGSKLNRPIDNISGATMSVNALRNLAKLALFLDGKVQGENEVK